jgi:hypothetical protein
MSFGSAALFCRSLQNAIFAVAVIAEGAKSLGGDPDRRCATSVGPLDAPGLRVERRFPHL